MGMTEAPASDPFAGMPAAAPMQAADPFAGMPTGGGKVALESSKLREWETNHERELEELATQESSTKNETRKAAADDLGKWYEERKDTIQKKASTNRKDEQTVLENREALPNLVQIHGNELWTLSTQMQEPLMKVVILLA